MAGGPYDFRRGDWHDGGEDWVRPTRPPSGRPAAGRRRPRGPELGGRPPLRIPRRLPTTPTVLAACTAVVLAFVLGRATGGGEGSATEAAKVVSTTATTTTTVPVSQHTVEPGDTLASIASQYGVTAEDIVQANGISNPNRVLVGQVLVIPPPAPPVT